VTDGAVEQSQRLPAALEAVESAATQPAKKEAPFHHRRKQPRDARFERSRREHERAPVQSFRSERREKPPDPNSPFAKLAALKAQLEAEAKERS
jgi:hypothetical protein